MGTVSDASWHDHEHDAANCGPKSRWIGRFLVLNLLGRGGMSVVFEAHDKTLNRTVALKLLDSNTAPKRRIRLLREAQALARLSHPNVVQIYDVGTIEDQTFIAMELVRGQTLGQWRREPRDWRTTVAVYVQAGEGLAAAHRQGLVHRDFKPDNCILGEDGRARVLDFGLAREAGLDEPISDTNEQSVNAFDGDITRTGAVMGTLAYMSCEQFAGTPADPRSDQFSFCVSLYEALYGERPFAGANPGALYAAILDKQLRPPPEDTRVSGALRQIVLRGLEVDPDARWPSMDALLDQLRRLLRRRRQWRAAALVAGGIGLGALSVVPVLASGEDPCRHPEAGLDGSWGPEDRDALELVFARHGPADEPELWPRVEQHLDRYVQSWVQMAEQSCRATFVTQQQSETLFERRARCLDRHRNRLRATIDSLGQATSTDELIPRVVLPFKLPSVEPCADLEALTAEHTSPLDPPQRRWVADLRRRIDLADTLREGGQSARGLELARAVHQEAVALGDPLVLAEALECLGRLLAESASAREATATLEEAVMKATLTSNDALVARAWISLLYSMTIQGDFVRAKGRRLAAAAAVERTDDDILRSWLLNNLAALYGESNQLEQAATFLEHSLKLKRRTLGEVHVDVGIAWYNLGNLRQMLDRPEEAKQALIHAREIFESTVGRRHPLTIYTIGGLCPVERQLGHPAAAIERCDEALALLGQSPSSPMWESRMRFSKAEALWDIGRQHEAVSQARQAHALIQKDNQSMANELTNWLERHSVLQ